LAPSKRRGQNFLVEEAWLDRIVAAAGVGPGDRILEIGAGLGALTETLAKAGASVWALEIDSGFVRTLKEKFATSPGIEIIHDDALRFDYGSLYARHGRLRVAANLPYATSSRLLFHFCLGRRFFDTLHVTLQAEVAERLTAEPGTKQYGLLTVLLGAWAEVERLFLIPPEAFYPVPSVMSQVVRVTFKTEPPVLVADGPLFVALVKTAFSSRRKTLRNNLRGFSAPGLTPEMTSRCASIARVDLGRRAETLSPQEFISFADALAHEARRTAGPPPSLT
jgi:16S rRNA (adenine1518-N6/adenine1519-N6)-dimethyltransferase